MATKKAVDNLNQWKALSGSFNEALEDYTSIPTAFPLARLAIDNVA